MTADKFEIHGNHAVYPNGAIRPLSADERTRNVVKEAMAKLEPAGYVREPNGYLRKQSIGERARAVAEDFVRSTSLAGDRHMNIDGAEVIRAEQDQQRAHVQDPNLAGQSELFDEKPAKKQDKTEKKKERGFFDVPKVKDKAKMSNDILRSGLFSVRERKLGHEEIVKDRPVATFSNAVMTFSGVLLDQQDYRVYEALIQEYKESGCTIRNKLTDILRSMNLPDNTQYRDSVFETLKRLRQATIFIQTPGYKYVGGLVNGVILNEKTDDIQITLGPELAVMFSRDNWTWLDRSHRAKLGKNHLAAWLFNFASTHEHMFPISRHELRRLSESTQPQKKFNMKLKLAIGLINQELGEFGWHCELVGELLKVHRKQTKKEQETVFI